MLKSIQMKGIPMETLRESEERSFRLLCQMRQTEWRGRGGTGSREPSPAMFCGIPLLMLLILCAEAEEDQKKTWMKTTPHLKYLLVWKRTRAESHPFPNHFP